MATPNKPQFSLPSSSSVDSTATVKQGAPKPYVPSKPIPFWQKALNTGLDVLTVADIAAGIVGTPFTGAGSDVAAAGGAAALQGLKFGAKEAIKVAGESAAKSAVKEGVETGGKVLTRDAAKTVNGKTLLQEAPTTTKPGIDLPDWGKSPKAPPSYEPMPPHKPATPKPEVPAPAKPVTPTKPTTTTPKPGKGAAVTGALGTLGLTGLGVLGLQKLGTWASSSTSPSTSMSPQTQTQPQTDTNRQTKVDTKVDTKTGMMGPQFKAQTSEDKWNPSAII